MSGEPLQLPLFPDRVYLQKIVPEANQKRFYAMTAIPTLFGEWAVMREWGRIGSPGTVRTDFHADEGSTGPWCHATWKTAPSATRGTAPLLV